MSVPNMGDLLFPILKYIDTGAIYSSKELNNYLVKKFDLTKEDLEQKTDGGNLKFKVNVSWAKTHLKNAGLLEYPSRGLIKITEVGKVFLLEYRNGFKERELAQFESYKIFRSGNRNIKIIDIIASEIEDIKEIFFESGDYNIFSIIDQIGFLIFLKYIDTAKFSFLAKKDDVYNWNSLTKFDGIQIIQQINKIKHSLDDIVVDDVLINNMKTSPNIKLNDEQIKKVIFKIEYMNLTALKLGVPNVEKLIIQHLIEQLDSPNLSSSRDTAQIPIFISEIMVQMLEPTRKSLISDLNCGYGNSLLTINKSLLYEGHPPQNATWEIYGFDTNPVIIRIASLNLMLNEAENIQVYHLNPLSSEFKVDNRIPKKYDFITSFPPVNKVDTSDIADNLSLLQTRNITIMYLEKILSLLSKNGKCAVIVPNSFLNNNESKISEYREKLVTSFYIEGIVNLNIPSFNELSDNGYSILLLKEQGSKSVSDIRVWFFNLHKKEDMENLLLEWRNRESLWEKWYRNTNKKQYNDEIEYFTPPDNWDKKKTWFATLQQMKINNFNLDGRRYNPFTSENINSTRNGAGKIMDTIYRNMEDKRRYKLNEIFELIHPLTPFQMACKAVSKLMQEGRISKNKNTNGDIVFLKKGKEVNNYNVDLNFWEEDKQNIYSNKNRSVINQGRFLEAKRLLQDNSNLNDDIIEHLIQLSTNYEKMGNLHEARELLDNVLKIDENNSLAQIEMSKIYQRQGEIKKAEHLLNTVIARESDNLEAKIELSRIFHRQGHLKKAEQILKSVLSKNANNFAAQVELSSIYLSEGSLNKAEQILKILVKKSNDIQLRIDLGEIYKRQGKYITLKRLLKETLEIDIQNIQIRLMLSDVYQIQGDLKRAESELLEILKINNSNLEARIELGKIYRILGDINNLEKISLEILKIDKNNQVAQIDLKYINSNKQERSSNYDNIFAEELRQVINKFCPAVLQKKLLEEFIIQSKPLAIHEAAKLVNTRVVSQNELKLGVQEAKQTIELFVNLGILEKSTNSLNLGNTELIMEGNKLKDRIQGILSIDTYSLVKRG